MAAWHVIAGEYPPAPGGVSDHARLLAAALGDARVWTTPADGEAPDDPGVAVDREAGRWTGRGLRRLSARLDEHPSPRRLLVHYTPNAWGYRGMNLGLGRWLRRRAARGDAVWSMVHEPFYEPAPGDGAARWLLAAAHRRMIRDVLAASTRVFAPTPTLAPRLAPYTDKPVVWLPAFSNVPVAGPPRAGPPGGRIGCFGTFAPPTCRALSALLPILLEGRPGRSALLIGRGGGPLAAALGGRVEATGGLPAGGLSAAIASCDLMVQPYGDGVCARRTTAMAGLAHGVALATNSGVNTEPLWAASGAVALAVGPDPRALAEAAEAALSDDDGRARLAAAGRDLYGRCFDLRRAVETLRGAADGR